tara:strand:- start:5240 stop:5536 length:297 start_codon:yes stop_codon:yes gene_type:complete
MDRKKIFDTADSLVNGQRAKDYGDCYENHEKIAKFFDVIAKAAIEREGKITPPYVALMMSSVKIARLCNTIDHEDSWVDLVAYGALGGEMSDRKPDDS